MSQPIPLTMSPPESLQSSESLLCRHCGGSGKLRISEEHSRTCLECLGEGRQRCGELLLLPVLSAAVVASGAR